MRAIDGDALIHELNNSHYPGAPYIDAGINIAIGKVCDAPTIEPKQKTGKWMFDEERGATGIYAICSACDESIYQTGDFKYCPNCGAYMKGEPNED